MKMARFYVENSLAVLLLVECPGRKIAAGKKAEKKQLEEWRDGGGDSPFVGYGLVSNTDAGYASDVRESAPLFGV
jgi:hypothetical protein